VTHYDALMARGRVGRCENAGKVDRNAGRRAGGSGLFDSPTGPITIGKDHHSTMTIFHRQDRKEVYCPNAPHWLSSGTP